MGGAVLTVDEVVEIGDVAEVIVGVEQATKTKVRESRSTKSQLLAFMPSSRKCYYD